MSGESTVMGHLTKCHIKSPLGAMCPYNINIRKEIIMSSLHHESLLETCYDEAWEDYRKEHNLTSDQLDALDQKSELGYLPIIAEEAQRRFEDLCL